MRFTLRKLFTLLCVTVLGEVAVHAQDGVVVSSEVVSSEIINPEGVIMDGGVIMGESFLSSLIPTFPEIGTSGPLGTWYVDAGTRIMRRNVASSTQFATNPNGTPLSTAREFDFNWVAGPDLLAGRMINDCLAVEFEYFGLYGMNAGFSDPGPGFAVGSTTSATNFFANYRSSMTSVELNARYWLNCEMSILGGFRFVNWHEEMNGGYTIPGTTTFFNNPGANIAVNGFLLTTPSKIVSFADLTNNNLYGVQTGGDWRRCFGRFGIEAYGKLGLYGDETYGRFAFINGTVNSVSTVQGQAAFLGEFGFFGTFKLSDCITLRAGYNLMWLDGLAIIPQQNNTFTGGPGSNSLDSHSGVFLQGFMAGGEVRW
jgi:hypothetical protein